jgi:hypothetical protein
MPATTHTSTTTSRRPAAAAWTRTLERLLEVHELQGFVPAAHIARAAREIGVLHDTVDRRVGEALCRAARADRVRLSSAEIAAVSSASDYLAAIGLLRRAGRKEPSGAIERAFRTASGLLLIDLNKREQARRLADSDLAEAA